MDLCEYIVVQMENTSNVLSCPSVYYQGLHLHRQINWNDIENIKKVLDSKDSCKDITIIQQIGSPSEEATVWEAMVKTQKENYVVSVKISRQGFYRPTEYLINQALLDYPDYFLRMFAQKDCTVTIQDRTDKVKLLFMELAIGDLYQILMDAINEEMLNDYILDVFDSEEKLAELGIKHNDLHIRNVFIICNKTRTVAVLGDFGKSIPAEFPGSNFDDLLKFFGDLKEYLPYYMISIKGKLSRFLVSIRPIFYRLEEIEVNSQEERNEVAADSIREARNIWLNL